MLHQLKTLKSGVLEDPLVEVLREVCEATKGVNIEIWCVLICAVVYYMVY